MPTRFFPTFVEWQQRPDKSAWISVGDPDKGPHFQCDFLGDMEKGPVKSEDFVAQPPRWVQKALSLDAPVAAPLPMKETCLMDEITRQRWAQLQDMHRAACFEAGDHPDEVDTAFSAGADAIQRLAAIDARAEAHKEVEEDLPGLA